MNIAINTRLLLKDKMEGIGWFTYETIKRMVKAHPEHNFLFIFDRPYDKDFIFSDNVKAVHTRIPCRHPVLWYLWFRFLIPPILKRNKIDLFISPDGFNVPKFIKSYIVVHDVNFVHFPENVPFLERKFYQWFMPKYIKDSCRLGTVSEFSKNDIVKTYGTNPEKIDILCNGASDEFIPISNKEREFIKKEITGGSEYYLFVGALNPRKNISRLLEAFDIFCEKVDSDVKLVVAGAPMFSDKCYIKSFNNMKHKDRVLFIGRQPRKNLGRITAAALAMVYPSTFEGFGIPIIEAMNCDVPVITSNITSMPEVAGDAAILIDPYSIESISRALIKMSTDIDFRISLIEKGRKQRNHYTWEKAATLFWESIEKCL